KMKQFSPTLVLSFGCLCAMLLAPREAESLGFKKGLKILAPLALIGGAAGAGGLAGAWIGSRHKHPPVHHHHVKHVHYHPIHHVNYVHHEPTHHVKVVEKHVDHGWEDGWYGDLDGWSNGYDLDGGHGWW
ncbi:hypothetical protein BIW11_14036, partial [Tropilaelaps mercedesae]